MMPDEHNTRDDAESAERANETFARELCDAAVLHAAKFSAGAEMLMHWRVNRALRERLVAELDARDAAPRAERAGIVAWLLRHPNLSVIMREHIAHQLERGEHAQPAKPADTDTTLPLPAAPDQR